MANTEPKRTRGANVTKAGSVVPREPEWTRESSGRQKPGPGPRSDAICLDAEASLDFSSLEKGG
jgi:hypothetical protein